MVEFEDDVRFCNKFNHKWLIIKITDIVNKKTFYWEYLIDALLNPLSSEDESIIIHILNSPKSDCKDVIVSLLLSLII